MHNRCQAREYCPPEILQHHLKRAKAECDNSALVKMYEKNNSAYDIWMLGILMLEIATGCPIWID